MKFIDLPQYIKYNRIIALIFAFLFDPGFLAISLARLSQFMFQRGRVGRIFGILLWRANIFWTGCHISPKARISGPLYLPHAVGIVIGDGVIVGSCVTIFQNVTLGSGGDPVGYPQIADDVIIYPGAVVVGSVRIGNGVRIGANAFVSRDIADGETVAGVPARSITKTSVRMDT